MTEHFAYTFSSELTLEQMFQRLNEAGPWKWVERENDRWANYMSTPGTGDPHRWSAKILADPDDLARFAVDVVFTSRHPDASTVFQGIRTTLFGQVLPAIGARALTAAETYE